MFRNRHRVGDWLVEDDESGDVHYASEMAEIWDGTIRHTKMYETRQPQEFIKALGDPYPVKPIRPQTPTSARTSADTNFNPFFIGQSGVPYGGTGPGSQYYAVGIGTMAVDATAAQIDDLNFSFRVF